MAFASGNIAVFSFDNHDISEFVEMVSPKQKRDDLKLPRLGGNSVARLVGPVTTDLEVSGWFDATVDGYFAAKMAEATPSSVPIEWQPQGAAGGVTRTGNGWLISYDPDTDASKPGSWKATISIDGDWS